MVSSSVLTSTRTYKTFLYNIVFYSTTIALRLYRISYTWRYLIRNKQMFKLHKFKFNSGIKILNNSIVERSIINTKASNNKNSHSLVLTITLTFSTTFYSENLSNNESNFCSFRTAS